MNARYHPFDRGQILILVAVTLVILIGFVGLAIDSGRGYGVKAKLNSAVDAAAIAGARALSDGSTDALRIAAARQAARNFYTANFPTKYLGADLVALTDADIIAERNAATGVWRVAVTGSAIMPVTFMGVLGFNTIPVIASGETVRPPWDVVLVLDTSGSLGPPTSAADTLTKLKAAAVNFVNTFNSGSDLVGVVSFASGAVVDESIKIDGTRGFVKTQVVNAINALTVTGSTASAEGIRLALNQLNRVPVATRSNLRAIVFFSDGAPNDVPATFMNGATAVTGDLYSETDPPATDRATNVYRSDTRDALLGTYANIASLPSSGFSLTDTQGNVVPNSAIALSGKRALTGTPTTNNKCNVNKAARNMVENVASTARAQGIAVYSIGLGARVNSLEITFCSYGSIEQGSSILKRLANTADSDTYVSTPPQPTGLYAWAENASGLNDAFLTIARAMVRLNR